MLVSPDVTRAHVERELSEVADWADARQWVLSWDPHALHLALNMTSAIDGEVYHLEVSLDDYRAMPPLFEFVHAVTHERGSRRCYPKGGRGYFHSHPVVCAPWNRKAYGELGGPHPDWSMVNWTTQRPNHTRLGDMLVLLQELIDDPDSYGGRMER